MPAEPSPTSSGATADHTRLAVELLVEVLSSAERDLDRAAFYSRLAEVVCRIGAMRRAVIFRFDDLTRRVQAAGGHGVALEAFSDLHIGLHLAPEAARALTEDRVVEVRPPAAHRIPDEFAELVGEHSLVYVPIAAAGRWPGVMIAQPLDDARPLEAERTELLWTLGKTLALASVARSATYLGERARELEERIDLARDIHERVVQRLFGVSMALSVPGTVGEEDRERCAGEIQEALAELRAAVQRPLGRLPRVTQTTLAAELERLAGMRGELDLRLDGDLPEVPAELEPLFQSVLAEALRNVGKHAESNSVTVRAWRRDGFLGMEVENDGVSRPAPGRPPGIGLRLAAFEALQAGGLLDFGERIPGCWQVRLVVPVPGR